MLSSSSVGGALPRWFNTIEKPKIFEQLTSDEWQALCAQSAIKIMDRNETLVLDDRCNRFYVVLDGWFKLFSTAESGKEAIVEMANKESCFGKFILDTCHDFDCNAQLVGKQGTLLCVPAPVIEELLKTNSHFSYHMMKFVISTVNKLRRQIEKINVMNAEERVIAHLEELMCPKTNQLQLPYSKSLMATQLGMKPETFSRVLKQLNRQGIKVKGNEVCFSERNQSLQLVVND